MTWNIIAFSFLFFSWAAATSRCTDTVQCLYILFSPKAFFASLSSRLRYYKLILCVYLSCLPAQTQVISVRLVIHLLNWIVQKFVCNLGLRATEFLTACCRLSGRDERGVGGLMKCLQQQQQQSAAQRRNEVGGLMVWKFYTCHTYHTPVITEPQSVSCRPTEPLLQEHRGLTCAVTSTTHLFQGLKDFSWLHIFFPAFGLFLLQEREWRESVLRENRTRNFYPRFWLIHIPNQLHLKAFTEQWLK